MGAIVRFEDLNAWKEARKLFNLTLIICRKDELKREFYICDQIKRSAISIMANIAEGFGRYGLKDSKNFYIMARGSLTETQSHLHVLQDSGYLSEDEFKNYYLETVTVSKLINGLISNSIKFLKKEHINI